MTQKKPLLTLLYAFLLTAFAAIPSHGQTVIYVDATASSPGEGDSWESAYPALQDAFDESNASPSTDYEIWVAEGTYYPDVDNVDNDGDGTPEHTADADTSFTLTRDGVALYGGFDGGEDSRTGRDPDVNTVVLSGDVEGDDDQFAPNTDSDGDPSTPTQTDHINGVNATHVILLNGKEGANITSATVLDGITITAGYTDGGNFPQNVGGGLLCDGGQTGNECSASLTNLTVEGNFAVAGGGLFNSAAKGGSSNPEITNLIFSANAASSLGGAMYNDAGDGSLGGTASPSVSGGTFSNNAADLGGAVYNEASGGVGGMTVSSVTFENNSAGSAGGAVYNFSSDGGTANPEITGSDFLSNSAEFGGAVYINSDSTDNSGTPSTADPSFTSGTTFSDNSADEQGGAVLMNANEGGEARPEFSNVTFSENEALGQAGAVEVFSQGQDGSGNPSEAEPSFTNVRFLKNTAYSGGAIANYVDPPGNANPSVTNAVFSGNSVNGVGGAILNEANLELVNASAAGNTASTAGDFLYNLEGDPTLTNLILWNTTSSSTEISIENGTPSISYSVVKGGCPSGATCSGNLLDENPQFAGANGGAGSDGTFGTSDDDLRLQGPDSGEGASSAIDAGDNTAISASSDLFGNSRNQDVPEVSNTGNTPDGNPPVDIGAHESAGDPLPVELAVFEAQVAGEEVVLSWNTASEQNNAGFAVQREKPTGSWENVGLVETTARGGTSSEPQSYRFTDEDLPYEADSLTYRLKQIDTNGSASYSETVTVERGVAELELLSTYPNPAQSQAVVRYAVPENQDVAIRLYDTLGRQVRTVFRGKQEGRKKQQIDLSGLSSGVFFLRLRAEGATKTQKLTVVR